MLHVIGSWTSNGLPILIQHIQFNICYFSPHENTKAVCYVFTVQTQGISKTGAGDTGWLCHKFCSRTIACIYIWGSWDSGTSILQVHTPGRPFWCGRLTSGSTCAVHATYCTHLPTRERRGLLGTVWLGCWLGRSAGRYADPADYFSSYYEFLFQVWAPMKPVLKGQQWRTVYSSHCVICLQAPDFALRLCKLWMCQW